MANEVATISPGRSVREKKGSVERSATMAILEFQSPSAELIARPIPWSGRIVIWSITAAVAAFAIVAGVFPIDRVVTSSGKVVSKANNIVIQPLDTAIVRQINVHEGEIVHKGDILAQLDPTFATADMGNYAQQTTSLQAEVDRLTAETEDKPYKPDGSPASQVQGAIYAARRAEYNFKLENYRSKIASAQSTVQRAMNDVQSYSQRLEVAKIVEDKRRELERLGVGSQLNLLSALDSRVEVDRGLRTARAQIQQATSDLTAIMQERDGYVQQRQSEASQQLTEQSRKLADAREQLNKATLRKQLVVLSADKDAIVLSIAHVSVGSVLQSGDQFITLVPLDAPLEVEVNVPGRDSGFVHVDDPVNVKFDTFNYSLYGYAKGTVRLVSPDSFTNPMEDRSRLLKPSQMDENGLGPVYYRARVSLDEVKLHDLPSSFRLTPGMSVSADIKVGQRTALGYLMGRIIPHMSEGFREP